MTDPRELLFDYVVGALPAEEARLVAEALDRDPELRQRAIFWLGESDDPRVPEFLMEILRGGGGA